MKEPSGEVHQVALPLEAKLQSTGSSVGSSCSDEWWWTCLRSRGIEILHVQAAEDGIPWCKGRRGVGKALARPGSARGHGAKALAVMSWPKEIACDRCLSKCPLVVKVEVLKALT